MSKHSTATYRSPLCKGYWRDAAAELKNTRTLVVTALLIALRIILKPLAIPLGSTQLTIPVAMLAAALGAMIYGPVVAIPAALISDTVGFMIHPTGDYFLPFALTEIAGTFIYALCLYRTKVTPTRVMIARFAICFLVNVVLQQLITGWWWLYMGNPEKALKAVLGITTLTRLVKNTVMFPIESVVMTLFLGLLLPITNRMGLTFGGEAKLTFRPRHIVILAVMLVIGIAAVVGYLHYTSL